MKPVKIMFLLLASLMLVSVVYATPPKQASGSFDLVKSEITGARHADNNTIITLNATFNLTGTFDGTYVEEVKQVINSTGKGTFQGRGTFHGTVDGVSGSVVLRIAGTINGSLAHGQLVIQNGTGGLENLHGQGTFDQNGTTGTYSARIHFDPS